jgi:putative transposase
MVEFADFNHKPMETPMTETTLPLIELLQKQDDGTSCALSPRRCCSC